MPLPVPMTHSMMITILATELAGMKLSRNTALMIPDQILRLELASVTVGSMLFMNII